MYIQGPSWLSCWEGLSIEDICSSLTRVQAQHWHNHTVVCTDLINRKIHATFLGLLVIGALVGLQSFGQILSAVVYISILQKHMQKH